MMGTMNDTTEHLTVDQIIDAVYAAEVPPGDPDDHDMLFRLAQEILRLRRENASLERGLRTMDAVFNGPC